MIRKIDRVSGRYTVMIFAGELYVSTGEELVMTTVGGCVCVCIVAGERAGMNHYLLPQANKNRVHDGDANPLLYGVNAIGALIEAMEKAGCQRERMIAMITGGSDSFSNNESPNVRLARLILESEDISIKKLDVGGNYTRRVVLDPKSGSVHVNKSKGIMANGKNPGSFC